MAEKMRVPSKAPTVVTKRMKGEQTFNHDLYKLGPAISMTNVNWQKYQPKLIEVNHSHVFHSINDKNGQPLKYCSPQSGHFHEVVAEWSEGADGNMVLVKAECGPALDRIKVKDRTGNQITKIVPRAFQTADPDAPIVDSHTHEVFYIDSEEINPLNVKRRQEEDRQKISHLTRGAQPVVKTLAQPAGEASIAEV